MRRFLRSRLEGRLVHPGELLRVQLEIYGFSQNELARRMEVAPRRVNQILLGARAITADTALRLARVLPPRAHYWMAVQADYDLEMAAKSMGGIPGPLANPPPRQLRGNEIWKRERRQFARMLDRIGAPLPPGWHEAMRAMWSKDEQS